MQAEKDYEYMFCLLKVMRKCAAVTQRNTNSVILISEPNLILKLYVRVIMGNLPERKKTKTVLQHFNFQHPHSFILKKYSCKT